MSTTALVSALKRVAGGRKLRFLAVLLSALALLFTAAPQVAHAAGSVTIGTGSGIRGVASLADAGISTITVVAYRDTVDGFDFADTTTVASGGTYALALEAGSYKVTYQSGGYRSSCFGDDPCQLVDVVDGQAAVLSAVTLVRTTPGTVIGKVVGGDGKPLAGAAVHASNSEGVADTVTDAKGEWVLPNLASEVGWMLEYTAAGHGSYEGYVYPVEAGTIDAGNVVLMLPGSVTGTIRDGDGTGIAGADVFLEPSTWGTTLQAATVADGTYSFADVVPGRYRIRVEADGHPGTYYPGVDSFADAKLVSVTESGTTVAADLTLITAGALTGHLTGDNGPVAGNATLYEQSRGLSGSVPTDDGSFSFTGLWPGRYTVLAEADGYTSTWLGDSTNEAGATWVDVTSGALSGDNDITLAAKPAIHAGGQVVDADGNPVPQVTVRLGAFEALSDAEGLFSLTVDHAGAYPVEVAAGAGLVCGGEATDCATATVQVPASGASDLVVEVPNLGSLTGAITLPDGVGIDWGQLSLVDSSGTTLATWDFSGAEDYFFVAVPHGTYTIDVATDGLARYTGSVTIGGAAIHDVALSSGFTISGKVTLTQGQEWIHVVAVDAASGQEVASLWRGLLDPGDVPYALGHLNAGVYKVGVQVPGGRWSWHVSGSDPHSATPVTVDDADVTGVDLVVSPVANVVRVNGHIQLPNGVAASSAATLDIRFENEASGATFTPVVTTDGSYRVDLPTGTYQVHVAASGALGTAPLSEDLRVSAVQSHDIVVPLGGSLTGRLVGAEGLGISGRVWVTAGGSTLGSVVPDSWGYWRLPALAAGPLELHASGSGFVTAPVRSVTVVAGQAIDTGAQQLVAAGRLTVRIPAVGTDVKVNVIVTDTAGRKLTSKGLWAGDPAERIDGIPAGPVLVRFESTKTITEWWRDSNTLAGATAVTVKAVETSGMLVPKLSLATLPADGTITGTVTNSTGLTGGLYVKVTGTAGTQIVEAKADGTWSAHVQPGAYKVQATLCAGYWLGASGCMGDHVSTWYPGASAASAKSVSVASDKTTAGINVDLGGPLAFRAAPSPTISGSAVVGGTLTAAAGVWKPATESFAYRWLRNGTPIDGATAAAYTVVTGDGGATLSVRVTGARAGYASTAVTSAGATVPLLTLSQTPVPTISGTAKLGATLTAVPGTWAPGTVTLAYQWLRDGAAIAGATAMTHVVVGADAGKALAVRVTGRAQGYASVSRTSAVTAKVPSGKMTTKTPTISGTLRVGRMLTAKVSGWKPGETTFTYTWYRSGKTIKGAIAGTYTLVAADLGKTIKVKATGAAVGYPSASATSKSTKKVAKGTIAAGRTVITGVPKVGQLLTIATADWRPSGLKFSYQWYRSGKAISKAKAAGYTVTTADRGKKLTVKVTASLSGYSTASKTSKATAAVVA